MGLLNEYKRAFKICLAFCIFSFFGLSQSNNPALPDSAANTHAAFDTVEINNLIKKSLNFRIKNQTESALTTAMMAYAPSFYNNYAYGISSSLEIIAMCYYSNSDYSNALIYELKYLDFAEKQKNNKNIGLGLKMVGAIYQKEEHYLQSLNYYKQSLKKFMRIGDSLNVAGVLTNTGLNYLQLSRTKDSIARWRFIDSTLTALNASLRISKNNNYYSTTASNLGNLSEIYTETKEYDKALNYANEAIQLYQKTKDLGGEAVSLFDIGRIYSAKHEFTKAIEQFQKSLKIARELKNKYLEYYCYQDLSFVAAEIGDYKFAYDYHKSMTSIRDSLVSVEDLKQINEMQTKYETEKKEALNKMLIGQNALSEKTIKQQKIINYFIAGGLIMAIIFSFFIFSGLKKQRAANTIISKQKAEVELKSSEIENQKHLVEEKQKEIVDSINYAKRIQDSLLDNFDMVTRFFSGAFVFLKPKDIVSGDFYWLSKKLITKKLNETRTQVEELFFIAVCDSTGHGVPGGFMSLLNTAYLSEAINEKNIYEPNKIFDYVRTRLINTMSKNNQKDGFDGVLMCFNKKFTFEGKQLLNTEIELSYSAAYNAPVLVRNNEALTLETNKMPVGIGERTENFTLFHYTLNKNDIIYLFTDGFADQFGGPKGKKYMYKQFCDTLLSISSLPIEKQSETLNNKFNDWKANLQQVDDVCVIGIKV